MRTRKTLAMTFAAMLAATQLFALDAQAETCSWNPTSDYNDDPDNPMFTDEAQYTGDYWFTAMACAQGSNASYGTQGAYYRAKFGFKKDYWDEGFGWERPCDERLPMARTVGALFALQNSYTPAATSWTDRSGPPVKWAYGYTAQALNDLEDLRAGCYGSSPDTNATTYNGIFDDYITLWLPFSVKKNVVARAPVLFHESLHYAAGQGHTCDKKDRFFYLDHCLPSGGLVGGCTVNPYPSKPSVYAWHVEWLISYHYDANAQTNPSFRKWAAYEARARVKSNFCDETSIPAWIRNF